MLTRRRFLLAAAGVIGGGVGFPARLMADRERVPLGVQPGGLPVWQHAWVETLSHDQYGNPVAPRFDRLLLFDVPGKPTAHDVRVLESSLRSLERAYPWGPQGLLFTVGWSPHYFEQVLGVDSPIPHPTELSDFELPAFDHYDLCVHLACDDQQRLVDVERNLVHSLGMTLRLRETRTGFVGTGLPAAHQHTNGIPSGNPVSPDSPLFMGFKSGFKKNQASEDDVTIGAGPFTGGTTMHVSYMRLRLDSWYGVLDEKERTARMYAPEVTPADVSRFTDDAPSDPAKYAQAADRYGVVGHSQTSARARRHGKPLIIRRDFNTVDGGLAGLHFVAVQKSISDFVTTRKAMNAANAPYLNPAIGDTVNNGINEFIFVLKRANYILPSRALRSYPLYAGQAAALGH
jgi:Dyp-type peroxidase family